MECTRLKLFLESRRYIQAKIASPHFLGPFAATSRLIYVKNKRQRAATNKITYSINGTVSIDPVTFKSLEFDAEVLSISIRMYIIKQDPPKVAIWI